MAVSTTARVKKRRDALRKSGLRPVQIWVPDTRQPNFSKQCTRQSKLAAEADMADTDMLDFMSEALDDTEGGSDCNGAIWWRLRYKVTLENRVLR